MPITDYLKAKYLIPIFSLVWAIMFLFINNPSVDLPEEFINTIVTPAIVAAIGIESNIEPKAVRGFRILIGLVIFTLGIGALLFGFELLRVSLLIIIGTELLGIGIAQGPTFY